MHLSEFLHEWNFNYKYVHLFIYFYFFMSTLFNLVYMLFLFIVISELWLL